MARDVNGTYTRVSNSFSSPVAGTTIDATHAEAFFDDVETEITDSLSRSGKGGMSADLDMNNNDINEIKTAVFQGSTSGNTTVQATAIAGTTTLTLPAATDTLVGKATTDTLTNKTISGASNTLSVRMGGDVLGTIKPQGRLTLATGVDVMTTTNSAKTNIFYTPSVGNLIPIYDGTNMVIKSFSEIQITSGNINDTTKNPAAIGASKINDWFVWNDGGTLTLSHGPDWTNDTTRSAGTALVKVNGVYLNNASITNGPAASRGTYVGTTRSNSSSQLDWIVGAASAGGTAGLLGVWNMYNRVHCASMSQDTASSTYTSATIRQYGGATAMQCGYVLGLGEDSVMIAISSEFALAAASGAFAIVGIGVDTTTAFTFSRYRSPPNPAASSYVSPWTQSAILAQPTIGYHTISLNQQGDGTNSCEFNNSLKGFISIQVPM